MVALSESVLDHGSELSMLSGLNDDQKERLTEQLDRYLVGLENGQPVDSQSLLRENADIAHVIEAYLRKLDAIYGIAVGFGDSTKDPSLGNDCKAMTLGDFTIVRELGRGGMGIVYEARQESLSRRVALKLLPIASLLDARQISRFKNEAYAAGLLHHPNIVPVYSVGSENGVHFYAMQYIDGQSMDSWVAKRGGGDSQAGSRRHGDWRTILGWAVDIAEALHTAHEGGIVHRDVKPSNLMLADDGKLWIMDFGLAQCQSDVSLTRSGDVIGTMRYMSPEQARGQSALIDGRTDIYSLASTVYELLTLQSAHQGDDAPTILKQIDEGRIQPLRKIRPDLPRDLETVLAKAMANCRDERYETAAEMANDLRRVLRGEATQARPHTIIDRLGRYASRHRTAVLATVLVGCIGLVGFAVSTARIASEKRISDLNAKRAQQNEQLAREAVDRLGSQMAELLADIPAADGVRRRLLGETLEYYQKFAASATFDPSLQEDLGVTLGKIGSLQSELGASRDSMKTLSQSESIYRELSEAQPGNHQLLLDWSKSQNNLAQSFVKNGFLKEAASYYARAVRTQEELLSDASSVDSGWIDDVSSALATTNNNLGLLLAETLAIQEAEHAYVKAIEVLKRATPKPEARNQLAIVQSNLSGLFADRSPSRSIEFGRAALALQSDALRHDPGNANLAKQVMRTLNNLGTAQSRAGNVRDAMDTFAKAIDISDQLLARQPDQPSYQRDHVICLNHLGLALCKAGKLREAKQTFESALDHGRPLAGRLGDNPEIQSMLGSLLNNLGYLQQRLGDHQAAAATFGEAVAAQSHAVRLAPDVSRYREFLSKHRANRRGLVTSRTST